jgi:zeta-carotene isomerase
VALLGIFALFHSGLAALRPKGEELIGARAYRVMFALISLPLATVPIMYFINHRWGCSAWFDQSVAVRGRLGQHHMPPVYVSCSRRRAWGLLLST